jgi:CRISPR-associated protein Cas6
MFTDHINSQLSKMGIEGKLICGRRRALAGGQQLIHGFSLVIHDLKPEASLQLQYAGLGEGRQFGCGLFVPHKTISGL